MLAGFFGLACRNLYFYNNNMIRIVCQFLVVVVGNLFSGRIVDNLFERDRYVLGWLNHINSPGRETVQQLSVWLLDNNLFEIKKIKLGFMIRY
jgi:hypothetical protein